MEGTLVGPWIAELGTTWRNASQGLDRRKLVIDLRNLTVISREGEDAIFDLMKEGAKFSCWWRSHETRVETTCAEETTGITTEVNMPETKHINSPMPYASNGDFQRIFHEDMNGLYLLAFLLTADREKAEQCFVSGLEDAVNGNRVFKEWARSWARRVIIQNAVRVMNPRPVEGSAHSTLFR